MSTPYVPEMLKLWTFPDHYFGPEWSEYYVFLGRNRDSSILENSNFESALIAIGGETETVLVVRDRHWGCGWIEWIAVHKSDSAALEKADAIAHALQSYPVVDERHYSEMEYDRCIEYWHGLDLQDRIELCSDAGVSIFAARRETMESDVLDIVRGVLS